MSKKSRTDNFASETINGGEIKYEYVYMCIYLYIYIDVRKLGKQYIAAMAQNIKKGIYTDIR